MESHHKNSQHVEANTEFHPPCNLADPTRRYRSAEEHIHGFQKLFDLRPFRFERIVSTTKFFGKKINPYFVIACIYNEKNDILVLDETKDEAWSLPGNYLACGENLLECLNRIVRRRTCMLIDVARPFCYVENAFRSEDGREQVIQKGIAFLVQARPIPKEDGFRELRKQWVSLENMPSKWYMGSAGILRLAVEELKAHPNRYHAPKMEIDSSRSEGWKYQLHHKLTSALRKFRPAKFIPLINGVFASERLAQRIEEILRTSPDFGSVFDAACGTDRMIVNIANGYAGTTIYANDLCWEYLRQIAQADQSRRIILLNQDLREFGFSGRTRFEVVLFKNTLHHLASGEEARKVIANLCDLGERVIVVDFEQPRLSNVSGWIWHHLYYKRWLKDCGGLFHSWNEFQKLVRDAAGNRKVEFDRLSTGKGRYMFAIVQHGGS